MRSGCGRTRYGRRDETRPIISASQPSENAFAGRSQLKHEVNTHVLGTIPVTSRVGQGRFVVPRTMVSINARSPTMGALWYHRDFGCGGLMAWRLVNSQPKVGPLTPEAAIMHGNLAARNGADGRPSAAKTPKRKSGHRSFCRPGPG